MRTLLAATLAVAAPVYPILAQSPAPTALPAVTLVPAPPPESVCRLHPVPLDLGVYVAPPGGLFDPLTVGTAAISVTYTAADSDEPWPQAAIDAFEYAASIWEAHIDSPVPLEVEAEWDDMNGCNAMNGATLGAAGPTVGGTFSGSPIANTIYPIGLINALTGVDQAPSFSDIHSFFNRACDDPGTDLWYFGIDGAPPAGRVDFVSVVLHELGHGLGFSGSAAYDDGAGGVECTGMNGTGCFASTPYAYDRFVVDAPSGGVSLLDAGAYPNSSTTLGSALIGNAIYLDGVAVAAANGHALPPIYSPDPWESGSSYSHLDEAAYNDSPHALMTPVLNTQEAIHSPGAVTCGLFQDMGWPLGPACASLLPVELTAFEALRDANDILLLWQTAGETNNAGFELQVSRDEDYFSPIGFIAGGGTTRDPQQYSYILNDMGPGSYRFRLKQIDFDGAFTYSPVIEVQVPLQEAFQVSNPYPNPFNPTTRFDVTVAVEQHVVVNAYDAAGREAGVLFDGIMQAHQPQTVSFEAERLPSGAYWLRITGETFSANKPVMLLK